MTAEDQTENIVLDRVTLFAAHGAGFEEVFGNGLDARVCVTPGATPVGATSERLLSVNRDGFGSRGSRVGPQIHDSLIERNGDDGIVFNGLVERISAVQGNNLTILNGVGSVPIGSQVEAFSDTRWQSRGMVEVVSASGQTLVISSATGVAAGDFIVAHAFASANGRIERNLIRNLDANAINVTATGTVITNNQISRIYLAGVALTYDMDFYAVGPPARNIEVSNNLLEDVAIGRQARAAAAAINVFPGPVSPLAPKAGIRESRGLLFRNNTVRGAGTWGMVLSNVDGAIIEGNRFIGTNALDPLVAASYFGGRPESAVLVRDSRNVVFQSSSIETPGAFMKQGLVVDSLSEAATINSSGLLGR